MAFTRWHARCPLLLVLAATIPAVSSAFLVPSAAHVSRSRHTRRSFIAVLKIAEQTISTGRATSACMRHDALEEDKGWRGDGKPCTPAVCFELTDRRRAIGIGLSAWIAGLTMGGRTSCALDPVKKTQELLRIWGQEEADNALGELASPEGGKTIQPVLALIPIVTLRLQLDEVENDLKEPSTFGDALAILQTQDFQKKDIKRAFNLYSDNIYYLPGSERENKYLQGGATPSTRQTLQYLLRNDIIDNVEALAAEISFLIREREAAENGEDNGADLDEKDLRMYLGKVKTSFDKYLGMVFQNEIDEATDYAKMALAAKKKPRSS